MIRPVATSVVTLPPAAQSTVRQSMAPGPATAGDSLQIRPASSPKVPASGVQLATEPGSPDPLEARMIALVNKDRADHGLPPLQHDPQLTAIATGHSRDMAEHGYFDHTSPTAGEMTDRYKAAGYRALVSAENLALNSSIEAAEVALMNSPGHRANLLNPRVTHIGIGIVTTPLPNGRTQYTITQNFSKPYEAKSDTDWRQDVRTAVADARAATSMPPLDADPALDKVTDAVAADIAAHGYDGTRIKAMLRQQLDQAGIPYRGYRFEYRSLLEASDAQALDDVTDPAVATVGVGLAQKTAAPGELPTTVSVVLCLTR